MHPDAYATLAATESVGWYYQARARCAGRLIERFVSPRGAKLQIHLLRDPAGQFTLVAHRTARRRRCASAMHAQPSAVLGSVDRSYTRMRRPQPTSCPALTGASSP